MKTARPNRGNIAFPEIREFLHTLLERKRQKDPSINWTYERISKDLGLSHSIVSQNFSGGLRPSWRTARPALIKFLEMSEEEQARFNRMVGSAKPVSKYPELRDYLKRLLKEKSQREGRPLRGRHIANRMGIDQTQLRHWLTGNYRPTTEENIQKFIHFFGMDEREQARFRDVLERCPDTSGVEASAPVAIGTSSAEGPSLGQLMDLLQQTIGEIVKRAPDDAETLVRAALNQARKPAPPRGSGLE